jgi:hypothetical protein
MHIFQTFTQQERRAAEGTLLGTMHSRSARKAPTCTKEQVSISVGESAKSIEGITVHSDRNTREEKRIFIEDMPVDVVVQRHNTTLFELTLRPFIRLAQTKNYHHQNIRTINKANGVKRMNVGLMKTIGEGMECSGIGSSQILTIPSLYNSVQNKASS